MRILVIEDEVKISSHLKRGLQQDAHVVDAVTLGSDGLLLVSRGSYDLVLLDLMLPDASGFDVLRQLKLQADAPPVIILSAKASVADRVRGLEAGADDYMTKPFSFSELLVRIRAIMRRRMPAESDPEQTSTLHIGDLVFDRIARQFRREDRVIALTAREYTLLEYLIQNQGCPVTKRLIFEHVWNYSVDPQTNVVDVLVCRLREKIEAVSSAKLIHTLRGVGYVFRPD